MNRIKQLREERGLFQKDIGLIINVDKMQISYLERGLRTLTAEQASKIADFFGVSTDYLLGKTNYRTLDTITIYDDNNDFKYVPVVGKVSAGKPILAQEYIETYLPINPTFYGQKNVNDLFFLKINGESMNKKLHNGEYALIRKQDTAETGDIVVAIVNGDTEATIKLFKRINEQYVILEPMSTDKSYQPINIDLNKTDFKIIGKAIGRYGRL